MERGNRRAKGLLASLSVALAVLALVVVAVYVCDSYWRHTAEEAAIAGVRSLVDENGGEVIAHLEPAPQWGDELVGVMEAALRESIHFKTNFYREKRQQHDYIAGKTGRVFRSSAAEALDIPEEDMKQADGKAILSIGESSGGMQSASVGRKAMVMVEEDGGSELSVSDEINCYAYAVRLEQSMPLSALLVKDGITLEYTALATATVRQDFWK